MTFRFYHSKDKNEIYGSENLVYTQDMFTFPPLGTMFWVNGDEKYRIVDYSISPDSELVDVMMIICDNENDLKGRF
jgi:hypothetical protein